MWWIFIFWVCLCGWAGAARGQVSGRVIESGGRPVPAATVSVLALPDSLVVLSKVTSDSGFFVFPGAMAGHFCIRVSSVGYKTWYSAAFQARNTGAGKDIGVAVLENAVRRLSSVVIGGTRPPVQQTAAGTIVHVENSMLSKGSSALAILERSPGVMIDHQHADILLNGKSGVTILINGKPVRMPVDQVISLLSGMSGDELARIELLTTPGAGYDAEGNAGVINLVLKKSRKQGTSGSIVLGGGYGDGEKANASVNLEHTHAHTTVYGSYDFTHDRSYSDFIAVGNELEPLLGGQAASVFSSVTKSVANNHNALVGIDGKLSRKTAAGGSINYMWSDVSLPTHNVGQYTMRSDSLYLLDAASKGTNHWRNAIGNVYLQQELSRSARLDLSADMLDYRNHYPTVVSSSFLSSHGIPVGSNDTLFSPAVNTFSNTHIRIGIGQADLHLTLSPKVRLEGGLKITGTKTSSSTGIESLVGGAYVQEPAASNNMVMREMITAGYGSLTAELDSSLTLTAGLRYEYSSTNISQVTRESVIADRKLSQLFPNLSLVKKFAGGDQLALSYSRRIGRPSYTDLASYVTYNGPTSVNTGNPLLLPTITDIVRLGFQRAGFGAALLYSRDKHPIVRYQLVESPDHLQLEVSPENMVYQQNLSLQLNIPVKIGRFWEMNYDLSGGWRKFAEHFTPVAAGMSYFTYAAHMNEQFKLPKLWSIELSGYYNGPNYIGSRKYEGYWVLNAGLRKTLGRNGGVLQFSAEDLLKTGYMVSYFGALTEEAFNLKSRVIHHGEASASRIFRLTYSRNFGGINRQHKGVELGEEKGRIGN